MTPAGTHPQLPLGLALRESARFESYFNGLNDEAVSVLQAAAAGHGEPLLVLAGTGGTGKTHLLQAACRTAADAGRSSAYLPMLELQLLSPAVFADLEQMDVVCVDDVHMLAGEAGWEQALFDLFNRLRAAGSTLLMAAHARPDQCGFVLPDLVSRLGWGLTYLLRPLPEQDVQAALLHRARGRGLHMAPEAAQFMLKRLPRDLSTLFDALDRLDAASMIEQRRLTIPFIKTVLGIG